MISVNDDKRLEVLGEYLDRFKYHVTIDKKKANWFEREYREELVNWTRSNCGQEYKDWYAYVGGTKDSIVYFGFITQSRANWFALKWSEYLVTTP
jgi:hypothetical protein